MNKKILIQRPYIGPGITTAMKAVALVAAIWGLVYPALLWSLQHLLQQG